MLGLCCHFNLGVIAYYQTKEIIFKLWEGIKNTSNNVIAGRLNSISVLCFCKKRVKVSTICEALDIRMSTIQKQVKKNVIEKYQVKDFVSLIKSAGLLKQAFKTLRIIEIGKEEELLKTTQTERRIDLVFGDATKILIRKLIINLFSLYLNHKM